MSKWYASMLPVLLWTRDARSAEAARLAGFGSAETPRRVFVTNLGVSPKAYRDRFRTTSPS
jgi:transcriptional regulator GlxA family with amidase domain